jgi:hypothetical protein
MQIALLVIGSLGKSGEISLKSIINMNPKRICVLANESGKNWLDSLKKINKYTFCYHDIDLHQNDIRAEVLVLNNYSNYRTMNFDLLTSLKWDLLLDIFARHQTARRVLFTDLDIFWKLPPDSELIQGESETMWVQYTPENFRQNWFCTGIMSLANTECCKQTLKELINLQIASYTSGHSINDEVAFNYHQTSLKFKVNKLSTRKYLIGKEYNKVFFAPSLFFPELICFHANYFLGNEIKAKILQSVESRLTSKFYWLKYFTIILKVNLKNLISKVIKRAKVIY